MNEDDPLLAAWQAAQGKTPAAPPDDDPLAAAWKAAQGTQGNRPPEKPSAPRPTAESPSVWSTIRGALVDAIGIPPGLKSTAEYAMTHPAQTAVMVGQGVPGGKLAQTLIAQGASHIPGVSSTGPMSYEDAFRSVDEVGRDAPLGMKLASKVPGAMLTAEALPVVKGWKAISGMGAGLSAVDRVLSAKPEPLVDRLSGTAKSAAIGAVVAPTVAALGDIFTAKNPNANIAAQGAERDAVAKPNYTRSLSEGASHETTPAIRDVLQRPRIQPIVNNIQQLSDQYGAIPTTDPRFLDQVYKELSAQGMELENSLESSTARDAASKVLRLRGINEDKQALLRAMESPGLKVVPTGTVGGMTTAQSPAPTVREAIEKMREQSAAVARRSMDNATSEQAQVLPALERHSAENVVAPSLSGAPTPPRSTFEMRDTPPVMPSYRGTLQDYAKRTGEMEATAKGIDAMNAARKGVTTGRNALSEKSDAAILDWVRDPNTPPNEIARYMEGLSGTTRARLMKALQIHSPLDALGYLAFGLGPLAKTGATMANYVKMGAPITPGPTSRVVLSDILSGRR